jgi:hypothetical protein
MTCNSICRARVNHTAKTGRRPSGVYPMACRAQHPRPFSGIAARRNCGFRSEITEAPSGCGGRFLSRQVNRFQQDTKNLPLLTPKVTGQPVVVAPETEKEILIDGQTIVQRPYTGIFADHPLDGSLAAAAGGKHAASRELLHQILRHPVGTLRGLDGVLR